MTVEEPPTARLCWKQDPRTGAFCDRRQHSAKSPHFWAVMNRLAALETLERPRPEPRKKKQG